MAPVRTVCVSQNPVIPCEENNRSVSVLNAIARFEMTVVVQFECDTDMQIDISVVCFRKQHKIDSVSCQVSFAGAGFWCYITDINNSIYQ